MVLGLKGSWKETKGCKLRYRLKELRWNLKYAWQRVTRGWDDTEKFAMGGNFMERMKGILQVYRKNHMGLFNIPKEYSYMYNNRLFFNEEETNTIIENIVDWICSEYHEMAKKIKDLSCGMVLIACLFSAIIGLIIFVPYIL